MDSAPGTPGFGNGKLENLTGIVWESKQLQEEQRCCSEVGYDWVNVGQRQMSMPGLKNAVDLVIWGRWWVAGQKMDRWKESLEDVPKLPHLVHLGESSFCSSGICFGNGPGEFSTESKSQSQLSFLKKKPQNHKKQTKKPPTKPQPKTWGNNKKKETKWSPNQTHYFGVVFVFIEKLFKKK